MIERLSPDYSISAKARAAVVDAFAICLPPSGSSSLQANSAPGRFARLARLGRRFFRDYADLVKFTESRIAVSVRGAAWSTGLAKDFLRLAERAWAYFASSAGSIASKARAS